MPIHATPPMLLSLLPPPLHMLLTTVTYETQAQGMRLWLVGGVVRDLLLGVPPTFDLDVAVEGAVAPLVPRLAAALGAQVTTSHTTFGTATLQLPATTPQTQPLSLDVAMARVERYGRPGALPEVAPATMTQDLARRDFSLNALALPLSITPAGTLAAGALLDPYAGRADLALGRLRVLHPASFRDDPTRILRGLRIAARLHFAVEPTTRALLAAALTEGAMATISPDRIRTELCLALDEPAPAAVLALANTWGLTSVLGIPLQSSESLAQRLETGLVPTPYAAPRALVVLGLLTYDLTSAEREALITNYRLPNEPSRLLREVAAVQTLLPTIAETTRPSALDRQLHLYSASALDIVARAEPRRGATLAHYLRHIRPTQPPLDGHDLRRLGIAPGPRLGQLLATLRAAWLDGELTTRAAAEAWVVDQAGTR